MNMRLDASQDASDIPAGMLNLLFCALGPGATGQVLARWMLSLDSSDREHVLSAYHKVFDGTTAESAG
jgi:hypothetical protein